MNLPKDFPELDALLEKMKVSFIPIVEEIDRILIGGRGIVNPDEYLVVDEIPTLQNRKVALHLQDAWSYFNQYGDYPKFHVVDCRTLQGMRRAGQYGRYHATRRSDGNFMVKLSESDELSPYKLKACKNCLSKLKDQYGPDVFPTEPTKFPLADWFEIFDYEEDLSRSEFPDMPFDYSSEAWRKRSLTCREKSNWKCEKYKIDLKDDRCFLHTHHKWGTKFNDPEDLMALCIRCHAEQPGGGHQMLMHYSAYQDFMKKYGRPSRSDTIFDSAYQSA